MARKRANRIEREGECQSCGATGLYSGMGEGPGAAVVCHTCKGTGKCVFVLEWDDFTERKDAPDVKHVYQTNPGIGVGEGGGHKFSDFGGMPVEDWKAGKEFERGTENRKFTCPAWWYQSADYKRKPEWDECIGIGSFSQCNRFAQKAECWSRFDMEDK